MLQVALKRLFLNAPVDVVNAGVSGNTTVDALNRIDADVLALKPQLVTVMFGLNDMTRVPIEEYEANLSEIIKRCRDNGAEVVLCTPNAIAETDKRSVAKLVEYIAGLRRVAEREQTPIADCNATCEAIRAWDQFDWLMLMSDEIHPSMNGHKLLAETIAKAVTGESVSLESEGPPSPTLPKTLALLKENKPIRIFAMPPYDAIIVSALKTIAPNVSVDVTPWNVTGMTLPQVEESSKQARELKPDLVIVAVPAGALADSKAQFAHSYKWVLNNALSFGHQEWDCLAVAPSVTTPPSDAEGRERDSLARLLIRGQDIGMVERNAGDTRSAEEIFSQWLREQLAADVNFVKDVADHAQLFIDNRFIADSNNVTLRMNPPVKAGPALMQDKPWETGDIGFCVSVAQVDAEYKMWYLTGCEADGYRMCFARSKDGVAWEKPELGLIDYKGSTANNIVLAGAVETTMFVDPASPAEQRYKAVAAMYWPDPQKAGLYIWTSSDGLRWAQSPKRVLPLLPDTANQAFYDSRLKKYVANIRVWDPLRKVGRVEMDNILEPWPYTPLDKPFFIWGEDKIPVPSREVPVVFGADENDPPASDFYNAASVQYPWADDAYFMFPSFYRHFPEPPVGKYGNDGFVDIQMAVSRDGVKWERPSRTPYAAMGLDGASDSSQLYMAVGIVRNGDEIYQYYGGYRGTHGQPEYVGEGSIQRLEQRLDGFMSVDAPIEGGMFTTPPIKFSGRRLLLNIDGSAMGTGKVALLDADGKEVSGRALSDCDEFSANSLSREVSWKGDADLSALAGKSVRIKFAMKSMKLYSFRFAS
jgi:lysophospholipase L1-like esterase